MLFLVDIRKLQNVIVELIGIDLCLMLLAHNMRVIIFVPLFTNRTMRVFFMRAREDNFARFVQSLADLAIMVH